jgi:hypothetical protein
MESENREPGGGAQQPEEIIVIPLEDPKLARFVYQQRLEVSIEKTNFLIRSEDFVAFKASFEDWASKWTE